MFETVCARERLKKKRTESSRERDKVTILPDTVRYAGFEKKSLEKSAPPKLVRVREIKSACER